MSTQTTSYTVPTTEPETVTVSSSPTDPPSNSPPTPGLPRPKAGNAPKPSSLTSAQTQMLLGTMLGDGSMSTRCRNPIYVSRHGWNQHAYNCRKYQVLSAFVNIPPKKKKNGGFGEFSSFWMTTTQPALSVIASTCLQNGKKRVTKEWLDRLTWEGVAWWYMDDGTLQGESGSSRHAVICTHGFSVPEVQLMVDWFKTRGLTPRVKLLKSRRVAGKTYPVLKFTAADTRKFVESVRPFLFEEMAYKIALTAVLESAVCHWCGRTFTPTRKNSVVYRTHGTQPCCSAAECRKARKTETHARYASQPGKQEQILRRARECYQSRLAANPDEIRRKQRQSARKYLETHAEQVRAKKKRATKKRQEQRRARLWTCQRCQLTEPQGDRDSRQRYCQVCRPIVSTEIKRASALRKASGQ